MFGGGSNAMAAAAIVRPVVVATAASSSSRRRTTKLRTTASVVRLDNNTDGKKKGAHVATGRRGGVLFASSQSTAGERVAVGSNNNSRAQQRRRRSGVVTFAGGEDDESKTTTTGDDTDADSDEEKMEQQTKNAVVTKAASEFDAKVQDIASSGLTSALRAVDERLEIAMKGEAAGGAAPAAGGGGGADGLDGEALAAARAASDAEAQAVDIVGCLQASGTLRGYGAARLVPRRDYALAELKLNGIEAEKLLSPTESTISGGAGVERGGKKGGWAPQPQDPLVILLVFGFLLHTSFVRTSLLPPFLTPSSQRTRVACSILPVKYMVHDEHKKRKLNIES